MSVSWWFRWRPQAKTRFLISDHFISNWTTYVFIVLYFCMIVNCLTAQKDFGATNLDRPVHSTRARHPPCPQQGIMSPLIAEWTATLADGQWVFAWHVRVSVRDRMSKCELIELKDLSVNDPIELAGGPPPVNPAQPSPFRVARLLGESVRMEAPRRQAGAAGAGHDFQPYSYTHLTWCDLCGEFIWGVYKQSLRCASEYRRHVNLFGKI